MLLEFNNCIVPNVIRARFILHVPNCFFKDFGIIDSDIFNLYKSRRARVFNGKYRYQV